MIILSANLDIQLTYHLQYNHYPPILAYLEPVKAAILAAREGDTDRRIPLPDGIRFVGKDTAPAYALLEFARAWDFVKGE